MSPDESLPKPEATVADQQAGPRPVRGRLAPSPTGPQHVGNARTYLLTWLSTRLQNGELVMRIEDLDSSRVRQGADEQAVEDLHWLGLEWDFGPGGNRDLPAGELLPGKDRAGLSGLSVDIVDSWVQSQRTEIYQRYFSKLQDAGCVYPCTCTRKEILQAASAPNLGDEGPIYPGTCRQQTLPLENDYCWRFRVDDQSHAFQDQVQGTVTCDLAQQLGDFIVARKNGDFAYQLAVTIDDHLMGITEVVRGDDLILSTFRQGEIYRHFGWTVPRYAHVPLVFGDDGRRLAKRNGSIRLQEFRQQQATPERLVGILAHSCGLIPQPTPISTADLLQHCRSLGWESFWKSLPREPFETSAQTWRWD